MNTTPDKKLTPMAAHIEWLKKERKTLYEFGYDVAADRISAAIDNATALREAEREYASQQAPAMYTREQVEAAFDAGMGYEYSMEEANIIAKQLKLVRNYFGENDMRVSENMHFYSLGRAINFLESLIPPPPSK